MISENIKNRVKKPYQIYLLRTNKKWFNHYFEYIISGKIIHVGNGLGFASSLIKEKNPNITSIDIAIQDDTINKDDVIIYNGDIIPFPDNSFDVLLCDYVIHHTQNPQKFINELLRVIKKEGVLLIVEQTYENLYQHCKLVYYCRKQNKNSEQKVSIYWSSYFSRKSIRKTFQTLGLEIMDIISEQRKSSFTELFVLKKH